MWWWCWEEAEAGGSLTVGASLFYMARSRTARASIIDPVSKRKRERRYGGNEGQTVYKTDRLW